MIYFLFLCSGLAGLVYQVVWVREFGHTFGNTIYSTSLVVSIFMLGLGVGGYALGVWADRRYERAPDSLLRAYGYVELVIAALALTVSLALPRLGPVVASVSSYVAGAHGWFELSTASYVGRGVIALLLLAPITVLMGGTLTLLIRHRVRQDVGRTTGWKISVLYAVNTLGAAAGAFLTDFVLVPNAGLFATEIAGVVLNVVAGAGALWLGRVKSKPVASGFPPSLRYGETRQSAKRGGGSRTMSGQTIVAPVAALTLSGFAAMGMEILWLRHFTLLLGGFRAVFSIVLTVMLAGIALGSLVGGFVDRRSGMPAHGWMLVQGLLVVAALAGLGLSSASAIGADARALEAGLTLLTPVERWMREVWFDLQPILLEIGLPSVLMGCSFPLANAVIQRAERMVGRHAGALYLANTAGAVCGALATGFVLLPRAGIQGSVAFLMIIAALAIVPVYAISRSDTSRGGRAFGLSLTLAASALGWWLWLPAGFVLQRSLPPLAAGERLLDIQEGVNEIVAVTEIPGRGRGLSTNGHPMSSTALLDQRYMRALAHIPLLAMNRPTDVLVIGFGVGNTTHAAALHPTVERIDVADLSRHIVEHADYFRDANGGVVDDGRVRIYVNDGRQHLLMQPANTYDLVTLEPPPIAHAGVGALYSREFYQLARSRLKRGGYLSQWLPAYQVPAETSLAMVRAFVDVFPQSVLLSGMHAELLLVGTTEDSIEFDPDRVARALADAPAALADLRRLDLGTVTQLAGTFVGSAETLRRATGQSPPVSDDRPLQEYAIRSSMASGTAGVPSALFDLPSLHVWCPRCFEGDRPAAVVADLEMYLALLEQAYTARDNDVRRVVSSPGEVRRPILGSTYLGTVVPDTDAVHNIIGVSLLDTHQPVGAAGEFREALKRNPDSVDANRNLGTALSEMGQRTEAIDYLRRAVRLDPSRGAAQYELGDLLLERREFSEAADCFRAAVRTMPNSAAVRNQLGIAVASMGDLDQAIEAFRQAVALDPAFDEARRNLDTAIARRRPSPATSLRRAPS